MNYAQAIDICKKLKDPHTEDVLYEREILAAVEKILSMATINAVPKEALLNVVRWFFVNCTVEEKPMTNADKIPAADVRAVVLCQDCTFWEKAKHSLQGRCALSGTYPTGGWFCANGTRL